MGLTKLVEAEEALAGLVRTMAEQRSGLVRRAVERWLAADAAARALSDEQREAVRCAAVHGLFVLTGGPGVGKTTALRVLVRCLQEHGRTVGLAAPTGKAAQRLGEVVGVEARTIHRMLGAGPQGFRYGRREPLPFETVIVDEASMLDTYLARSLMAAIGPRAQLILVGDADQLPSVGPGQVLRDLLAERGGAGGTPGDGLPAGGAEPDRARGPYGAAGTGRHDWQRRQALAEGCDCVFVPAPSERVAEVAAQWAAVHLPRLSGLAAADVQVLAPLTRVCQMVNSLLQERLESGTRSGGTPPWRAGTARGRQGDSDAQ